MEDDKLTLMKRLNNVLAQLEVANEEKSQIEQQLEEKSKILLQLEKKLEENQIAKESMDANFHSEIQYERDLNNTLNRDLKKYEHERDMLKDKLQDQENFKQQLLNDNNKLTAEYHSKTKELKQLEADFVEKQSNLTHLERELESLKNYQKFSREEKSRLEEEIERLTIEKKRLISKGIFYKNTNRLNEKRKGYD